MWELKESERPSRSGRRVPPLIKYDAFPNCPQLNDGRCIAAITVGFFLGGGAIKSAVGKRKMCLCTRGMMHLKCAT